MSQNETKKFSLGRIVATPGALHALHEAGQSADEFLARHVTGDWGDLDDEDKQPQRRRPDRRQPHPGRLQDPEGGADLGDHGGGQRGRAAVLHDDAFEPEEY